MLILQILIRFFALLSFVVLVGCASTPEPEKVVELEPIPIKQQSKEIKLTWELDAVKKYFDEWQAVKYRYGGLSKKGVDCSGFVYLAFLNQFGVELPRDTRSQVKLGETVAKNELKTGDLVFFKTSRTVRHVGIYLADNRFIHASSSKGVTTSSLDSRYWSRKYWTAKRLDISSFKSS